ncbi:hypothetical protein [Enterobacter asburiae]|uniref:hypothetical protein n=1 Tax=Enterobacter asburiae TaxID=61645 RepID=UPI001F3AAA34|nr:hypothetical protein [Enterobacter asburiae]
MRANPVLGAFTSEIQGISQTIIAQLDANYKVGRLAAYLEFKGFKGAQREAEDVLVTAIEITEAGGDI